MTNTRHKHYDLIVKWAADPEGYVVELRYPPGPWTPMISDPEWDLDCEYRLTPKPRTVHQARVEVPRPEREAPEVGTDYWVPRPDIEGMAFGLAWDGIYWEYDLLQLGLVYLNESDAIARAKAMLRLEE